jgi:hypothetical protein
MRPDPNSYPGTNPVSGRCWSQIRSSQGFAHLARGRALRCQARGRSKPDAVYASCPASPSPGPSLVRTSTSRIVRIARVIAVDFRPLKPPAMERFRQPDHATRCAWADARNRHSRSVRSPDVPSRLALLGERASLAASSANSSCLCKFVVALGGPHACYFVNPAARRAPAETSASTRPLAASVQTPGRGFGEGEGSWRASALADAALSVLARLLLSR